MTIDYRLWSLQFGKKFKLMLLMLGWSIKTEHVPEVKYIFFYF